MFFDKYKISIYTILFLIFIYIIELLTYVLFNISLPFSHLNTSNASLFSIILPAFLHANEFHLLRNVLTFAICMPIIEREIGSKKTLYLFIISSVGGLFIYFIYGFLLGLETYARGSSGASMFFVGIILVNLSYLKFDSEIKSFTSIFLVLFTYEYLKIILQTNIFSQGYTVLVAHMGGFTIGYITYILYRDYEMTKYKNILNVKSNKYKPYRIINKIIYIRNK